MGTDDAVEWRDDIGIAVIDGRDLGVDLGLLQIACEFSRVDVEVSSVACETACFCTNSY